MSWDELELLLLLSPGAASEARGKLTGHSWHGTVDIAAPGWASSGCLPSWENETHRHGSTHHKKTNE